MYSKTLGWIVLMLSLATVAQASAKYCSFYYKVDSFMMKKNFNRYTPMKVKLNVSGGMADVEYAPTSTSVSWGFAPTDTLSYSSWYTPERQDAYSPSSHRRKHLLQQTFALSGLMANKTVPVSEAFVPFAKDINVRTDGSISLEDHGGLQVLAYKQNWIHSPRFVMAQSFKDILLASEYDQNLIDAHCWHFNRYGNPERCRGKNRIIRNGVPNLGVKASPSEHLYYVPLFSGAHEKDFGFEKSDNTLDFENDKAIAKIRFYRTCW